MRVSGAKLADMPALVATYPDRDDMAARVMGDIIFGEPARYLAGLHAAAHGQPTWLYRFDVISPSVAGRWPRTCRPST